MKAFPLSPRTIFAAFAVAVFLMQFLLPPLSRAGSEQEGDAERGKLVFEKRCTGCHSLDQNKEGPHLRGVFGRQAGKIAEFPYSDGLKTAQFSWDADLLNKWLTDTESVIPDNNMSFHVPSAQERADVIRFLQESSGK